MSKDNIIIRKAERQDVPLLLDFIRGIAQYLFPRHVASARTKEDHAHVAWTADSYLRGFFVQYGRLVDILSAIALILCAIWIVIC